MNLKRDSRLARWAYWFEDSNMWWEGEYRGKVPHSTTLCAFFWRAFFFAPLLALLLAVITVGIATLLVLGIWGHPVGASITVGIIGAAITFIIVWHELVLPFFESRPSTPSVFIAGVKAVKSRFCPIIRFD